MSDRRSPEDHVRRALRLLKASRIEDAKSHLRSYLRKSGNTDEDEESESAVEQCSLCPAEADYAAEFEELETGETVSRGLCERHHISFTAWWMSMGPVENPDAQEAVEDALSEVSDGA
ncbi:hypothetical protein [Halolamina salifodinae]|uniref:CRISPR/Cas system-associated protein Cas10 (Large subunit of type III CRISPR-Cas system) n=1 Tax=Halolamina salifodinae TaxID=1202767 RepID=A0A8T4GYB3_9EURY|nr:hypothetical protein [Halolamina salifodinae]MBP1987212.1 CRISPR/Cas system-associated protein Cas10 (large subunit of type III CRISPR-Cas system) [Halolamina salifodinae]